MEKDTFIVQNKTIIEKSLNMPESDNQNSYSASKDQQLLSNNNTLSNNVPNQQFLNDKFSEKWIQFSNSINNLGLVLQQDISETSIKYLTIFTKKIQNIVTPTQALDFVINNTTG